MHLNFGQLVHTSLDSSFCTLSDSTSPSTLSLMSFLSTPAAAAPGRGCRNVCLRLPTVVTVGTAHFQMPLLHVTCAHGARHTAACEVADQRCKPDMNARMVFIRSRLHVYGWYGRYEGLCTHLGCRP